MELTTRIFRDLATLANWAFQASICEPGAYKLAEVAKNSKGRFNINCDMLQTDTLPECATWEDENEYTIKLSYNDGMQVYKFYIHNVFDLLARFKKIATKGIKAKEKNELCTMTKGDRDEILSNTVRAKVLQYKSDGNTLAETWESLTKLADGIYYYVDKGTINGDIANFVFEKNGIYWDAIRCDRVEYIEARRDILVADLRNFEANVMSRAEHGMFINTLHIEVMRRLGYDTTPLYASRNAFIKRREEEEKRKREEEQRREQERKEAEERRKAELLADGKKKLLNGEKIAVEQIELIAEAVGYKINIRTLGTMRKKLVSMSYSEANGWDYSYYSGKNTSDKSFNGAMDVIKSIYMILKSEESERENTTETVNVSEDETKAVKTAENITCVDIENMTKGLAEEAKTTKMGKILYLPNGLEIHIGYVLSVFGADYYSYEEWSRGKCTFQITKISIEGIAAAIAEWLGVTKPATIAPEPPQSPGTPQTAECATETGKEIEQQAIMQRVCEHLATPNKKSQKHLQHSGLFRSNTFRRLRVRRCFVVRWIVVRTYAENAAERKETGKFTRWNGCKYRQFTRGSTWTRGMNGMTGGANENISNKINEQYPGEMFCRGG